MVRILCVFAVLGVAMALTATPASAQFRFPPDRIFAYYDRDQDGELDEGEIQRVIGPLRERLEGRDSIGRDDFIRLAEEQQREAEGGRDGDDRDQRDGNRSSSGGKTGPKPRERVTIELASKYTEGDRDGDGQLGLYEWIQWKSRTGIPEFLKLDRNRDGFLTPYELMVAEKANSGTAAGGNGTAAARPGRPSAPGSDPAPAGGPRPRLDDETVRVAREAFQNLAGEDGKISEEEWQRSRATRSRFEEAGVALKLPADLDAFLAAYPPDNQGSATGGPNGGGPGGGDSPNRDTTGEGRFRSRGFSRDGQ